MAGEKSAKDHIKAVFSSKYSKYLALLLVIIPLLLAFQFRMGPVDLEVADTWATQSVQNAFVQQEINNLRQQFPTLPVNRLQARANERWQEEYEANKDLIDGQIEQIANGFRQRLQLTLEKPDGSTYEQTYLIAIDPYYYQGRIENVLEDGDLCDEITEDGTCLDTKSYAPVGRPIPDAEWHSYFGAFLATIFSWFGYAPITAAFFLPAIIASLATVPAFFIVQRKFGAVAGAIGASVVALHGAFLSRTPAGFADTDAWNVFFPLLIIWVFLIALDRKDKWQYAFMAGAAVLTAVYSKFWSGYFFTMFILLAVLLGALVFAAARYALQKNELIDADEKTILDTLKTDAIHLVTYLGITGVLISLFTNLQTFISAFTAPLQFSLQLQDPINANLWPNVFTTVAELNILGLDRIIGSLGGQVLFIFAALGIFAYAFDPEEMTGIHWTVIVAAVIFYTGMTTPRALGLSPIWYVILFSLPLVALLVYNVLKGSKLPLHYGLFTMGYFVAGIFATTQGTRFLLLLVPIYGLSIGFFAGWLTKALSKMAEKELKLPALYGQIIVAVVIILFVFTPVSANLYGNAQRVAGNEVPSMNDAWWGVLKDIEADSQEDAIITSWWDFGHWFKYVSNRAVTFDGAGQNVPQAHWVGRLFQTNDPVESIGILRMLNCGANTAFDTINTEEQNSLESYRVTTSLIGIPRNEAEDILTERGYSQELTESILEKTHCEPPESYLIASEDMIGKAGVWGHFGLWSFERSFAYAASKEGRTDAIALMQEELGYTEAEAAQTYATIQAQPNLRAINTWISTWPSYGSVGSCTEQENQTVCTIGINVGSSQGIPLTARQLVIPHEAPENATILIEGNGQLVGETKPVSLIYQGETYNIGGDLPLAARVSEDNRVIIADGSLLEATFTKLFYEEDDLGLTTLLTRATQINGQDIFVYKVDWDAYYETIDES